MISLIIPSGEQITRVNRMLTEEYGTASNIVDKSGFVVRCQLLGGAITSAQQRLKRYNRGLIAMFMLFNFS